MTTDWKEMLDLLGSENVERIKSEITDALIENLRESIDAHYLETPNTMDELMHELIEDTFKKERSKFKQALKVQMAKLIAKMTEEEPE